MSVDEDILLELRDGPGTSVSLAAELGWADRSVRRRLRRLIRDGYVFSPERGVYRLTAAGRAVMDDDAGPETPTRLSALVATPADVLDRLRGRQ